MKLLEGDKPDLCPISWLYLHNLPQKEQQSLWKDQKIEIISTQSDKNITITKRVSFTSIAKLPKIVLPNQNEFTSMNIKTDFSDTCIW